MLKEGSKAPAFKLPASGGKTVSLADHRGKIVVLYFYPKDSTPGCTTEACDFRDNLAKLARKGVVVLGVSKDSVASHDKFAAKYDLGFPLLSDADLKVHEKYGTWGEKNMYGKKIMGTIRSTFVIDGDGKVRKVFSPVRVKGHVDSVTEVIDELRSGSAKKTGKKAG